MFKLYIKIKHRLDLGKILNPGNSIPDKLHKPIPPFQHLSCYFESLSSFSWVISRDSLYLHFQPRLPESGVWPCCSCFKKPGSLPDAFRIKSVGPLTAPPMLMIWPNSPPCTIGHSPSRILGSSCRSLNPWISYLPASDHALPSDFSPLFCSIPQVQMSQPLGTIPLPLPSHIKWWITLSSGDYLSQYPRVQAQCLARAEHSFNQHFCSLRLPCICSFVKASCLWS